MGGIANFLLDDATAARRLDATDRAAGKGGAMRAIECPCGHRLEGADEEELFRLAREHVDRDHPELRRTDAELRARVAADAHDA
jgi:hypothetical protein